MKESIVILFPCYTSDCYGTGCLVCPVCQKRSVMILCTAAGLIMTSVSVVGVLFSESGQLYTYVSDKDIRLVYFHIDSMGKAFALFLMVVWLCA